MLAGRHRLALALCFTMAGLVVGPTSVRADEAAPDKPPAFAPGGFCARAIAAGGVRAKLCRILSGLLIRMEPVADRSAVRLGKGGGVYRDGELVTVTVDVPEDVDRAYLNVVFLDEAGEVVHLLPNANARDTEVRGGERVVLGDARDEGGDGGRELRAAPPRGRGMILALFSPHPLEPVGREEAESMGGFLASLQAALRGASGEGDPVRFGSTAIETRGR
jgi:hypothetical protein